MSGQGERFSSELAGLLHERNQAWAAARKSDSDADWLRFRQPRNRFSDSIRKAKCDYFLTLTTDSLNDPRRFWRAVNSLSAKSYSLISLLLLVLSSAQFLMVNPLHRIPLVVPRLQILFPLHLLW